ncbi:MAG: MarR family transcriptional regulator [Leptospirales bacterium]|nr:MarR family transcriptional regulator [Leptospirales bacterium]
MASNDLILSMGSAFRGSMDIIREGMAKKEKQSTLALSILIHVERQPGVSQGMLGKILRRDPMTMSQAVRALQSAGLISSQPDQEDRRIKRLTVTKKGKVLGQAMSQGEGKLLGALSRNWGKARINQFTKDLAEYNQFLTEQAS